jgi:23S rRNA (cytidine2498-2'-O)-methyltransferase
VRLLCYCREGFEATLEEEAAARFSGRALTLAPAHLQVEADDPGAQRTAAWVFARQVVPVLSEIADLPPHDRLHPLLAHLPPNLPKVCAIRLEAPDTNAGRALSPFLNRFGPLLEPVFAPRMARSSQHVLHLFFISPTHVIVGLTDTRCASPWAGGIPRLRVGRDAPSRSAAKLAEAFHVLVGDAACARLLVPGRRAVDLGAAPGGWSWWLAEQGLRVQAIDNGPLKGAALGHPLIEHLRADGFRYRWRGVVDWLTCDMVEQPQRVAQLVAGHLAEGRARQALFNLKLPMKQRWAALEACRTLIARTLKGIPHRLQVKQLYHDREEVTAWLSRE